MNAEELKDTFEERLEETAAQMSGNLGVTVEIDVEVIDFTLPKDIKSLKEAHGDDWKDSFDFTNKGTVILHVEIYGDDPGPEDTAHAVMKACEDLLPCEYSLDVTVSLSRDNPDAAPWKVVAQLLLNRSKKWGDVYDTSHNDFWSTT